MCELGFQGYMHKYANLDEFSLVVATKKVLIKNVLERRWQVPHPRFLTPCTLRIPLLGWHVGGRIVQRKELAVTRKDIYCFTSLWNHLFYKVSSCDAMTYMPVLSAMTYTGLSWYFWHLTDTSRIFQTSHQAN